MSDSEASGGAAAGSSNGDQRPQSITDDPNVARPFVCTEPGCDPPRAFARLEHLERHIRAHKGAAYPCDECGRSFARTDVLKRHKKLHLRDADPSQSGKDARKQAALERSQKACIPCAASKVKCSGEADSCDRCRNLGRECTYPESKRPEKRQRASSASASAEPYTADLFIASEGHTNNHYDFNIGEYPPSTSTAMQQLSPTNGQSSSMQQAFTPNFHQFEQQYAGLDNPHVLNSLFEPSMLPGPPIPPNFNFAGEMPFGTNFCAFSPEGGHAMEMDAGLQLATDDSMFWSTFLSPQALNPDIVGSAVARPNSPRRGRIMIAATGVATRHGSPSAPEGNDAAPGPVWPVWNPQGKDSGIMVDQVARVAEVPGFGATIDLIQLVPKFDESVRMSLLETLRFAQLTDHEYHSLYRTLSRIQLATYDRLLSLYFTNFHYIAPFLHLPTFDPHRTLGFLLLMLLGIGAVHAPLPGALQLGLVLLEVGRRGVEHLTNKDNRLARSLPMTQALTLWSVIKWAGSARNLELSEVFRGTYTTQVRRLHVFDEPSPDPPPGATVQERWELFIKHEERRRTGLVCFLLESEFTTLLHIPPSLELSEIRTTMPCARELWIAQTAEAWDEVNKTMPSAIKVPALLKLVSADSTFPLPQSVRLSAFASHILVKGLHSLLHSAMQLQVLANVSELASTNLRRSLGRIGRGSNEFAPDFGTTEDQLPRYAPACVSLHLAHVASYILLPELDLVAGRASAAEASASKAKIISWMISNRERAKTAALHAGQIVRIIRDHPTWGTYESSSLFYASLVLYLYSRSLLASTPSPSSMSYPLDARQVFPVDPSLFITTDDLSASLEIDGVGLLGDAAAPRKLLIAMSRALSHCGAVWRVGQVLSSVLLVIGGQEGAMDTSTTMSSMS